MADYIAETTVNDILELLKDVSDNNVWTSALSGLQTAANTLGLGGIKVPVPVPQAIVNDITEAVEDALTGGDGGDSSSPSPSEPQPGLNLTPIDPLDPLKKIAKAINEAEKLLNEENLVIATGTVEANLNVDVGGVAGANATIKVDIRPRPQA